PQLDRKRQSEQVAFQAIAGPEYCAASQLWWFGIVTSCSRVKSIRVSLGTLIWSLPTMTSEAAPAPAPAPAPIAAPWPPSATAPMIAPRAAPPTVRFAVLAPRDLPVASYSPVTMGTILPFTTIPVSSSRSCDLPAKVPDCFDCVRRP